MSHRSRATRGRQHVHCDACFSRRCRAQVEMSVCCAVVSCRLLCGAVFHQCKEEDHLLLCPNVRVPCLNAVYGCPLHLARSSRAAHLQECPASVVSCSMEWLRWLVDDTNPHSEKALLENVLKTSEAQQEALDLAVTLVDQEDLFARLKMKPLYPELMEEEEEEGQEEPLQETTEEVVVDSFSPADTNEEVHTCSSGDPSHTEERVQNQVGRSSGAAKSNLCDMMFSMERGGCAAAQANQDRRDNSTREPEAGLSPVSLEPATGPRQDYSKTGQAPWQEGVLERLVHELSPQEYNMYVVHHGRMLLAFGQIEACTPRERDFVYGSLEPIPVQTLRSFKVPDSYHYRHRVHLYDVASRAQSETRSVDTADLVVPEEERFSDEAAATLLGYAEREVMGHKISEWKGSDGLYMDVGTQTHSFRSAPFRSRTTLAQVMVERPLKLHLQLQAESVSSRHNRASSVFTFVCGHSFQRREFPSHCRNVHCDIQTGLSGWFEQRCPLAYLGCTYSQRRFRPDTHDATVTYKSAEDCARSVCVVLFLTLVSVSQQLRSFNLRPRGRACDPSTRKDVLSSLPFEVLCHMASFLDSLSLSQLALVSRLMRQVCSTQLQDRGMVTLQWERRPSSGGECRWRARPVWQFSRLFSTVDSWHMLDAAPISAHLKVCPYYQTVQRTQPVPLVYPSGSEERVQTKPSLVKHFCRWRSSPASSRPLLVPPSVRCRSTDLQLEKVIRR
ncbi:F-box only protein 40-like isoform X1 [Synchiropus splendidus]|uniref:F-box only protein 40-like isoform X1 n=1 Tax=Synchiropus splendidus TaxID=270530 RepID=UPI00237D944D|nr:F-box only protein 40-like isoform X1 [Synchiropus splendidus]XP_053702752.1 F-box only protein 40-like isoform X1 [Synchiropus splendidus]XP_053702753.1 F-box only protein 40-like isoform X1 [Synchiropus splendidus]XP_053702754.1 F-box only protein 40-like isoform X1 [Synchiropus splendidus]XP_053702755.1 F-box only protein 40-like isoform X1 [Synchiropus splendidus]XP_053702756.1 F-box only protein 40-like isoform X1 [Synchiropus splendidus]XP_053702757.1 F-box only protein 40-like isofo